MRRLPKLYAAAAVVAVAAMGLAACGGSSNSGSSSSSNTPVSGGTLNIVAASGWAHLDTVPAYYTADYMLERAYARQMIAYPYAVPQKIGDAGWQKAVTPVARHRDPGADHRERRDHQRRQDLHLPHQARRDVELQPGAGGDGAGLHP